MDGSATRGGDRARRFELAVQRSRLIVYNLAWVVGVVAKELGVLSFSWPQAIMFLLVINVSTIVFLACYARGISRLAGVSLRPAWMAFDVLIITWAVALSGGSESAWYPWYLTNAAAAAYLVGRRALLAVMTADTAAYVMLVLLTEEPDTGTLVDVVGKMLILFGAAFYALMAIQNLQEKRRLIAELRGEEARRTAELEGAVATITGSAQRLAAAADRLSDASSSMSANADGTAARAGEMSESSERVGASMETVADAIRQLSVSIQEIARNAGEADQVATEAVGVAGAANQAITKLGESSARIGGVVEAIASIAAQTRLLALNATIEATRAGDAGRGFAVVAAEVKELAAATARATEDIGALTETIDADAGAAVGAIRRVEEIVTRIHELQATIASAVEEQTATAGEISERVADAAHGGGEIARGITAVARAAEETSRGASTTEDAARELAGLAEELHSEGRPG
jgi:methyl-accepting chemotaxis protein